MKKKSKTKSAAAMTRQLIPSL